MSSAQLVAVFAAALTDVVQWLDYKTFGRASWYDRAILLLREASDVAPSLDDLKLAEARNIVRAALKERALTAHPPNAFFEELAMPVTPVGTEIFASELDELDTVAGKDYAAQATIIEEKWAEADTLWRTKAAPKPVSKATTRPKPTPKAAAPVVLPAPKVPAKRKDAPLSSDGEDFPSVPVRSGTQRVAPSSLFALTSGRIFVGKIPGPKPSSRKPSGRPERAVRRPRTLWSVESEDEHHAQDEDYSSDSKPTKKNSGRAAKRSKTAKSDKEAFPDEDPEAELSDWFVYRELRKCVKCAGSRAKGGVVCRMYQGETRCRRCRRTAQGCYWEISPGAVPVSYGGTHKQARDATSAPARAESHLLPVVASTLFVPHSEAARPAFRVDDVSYVEEFPSCLAGIRRRAALARVHPESYPASRAIADVVEQSLASAQIQLSTGLLLARSLLRDGAPGFRGSEADPAELEDPLDEDVPDDFTAEVNHPTLFRLEPTPLAVSNDRVPGSPAAVPSRLAEVGEPSAPASPRRTPDILPTTISSKIAEEVIVHDSEGSDGDPEENEEGDERDDAGSVEEVDLDA
ncbi:hypothetical protein EUX98_g9597 [Antrodiella citrinella]|uniref:Zn(2)-C6 fungal-type domain-containing protein n=1 Tax=Antrodiella citrinella TaxID=2447956 RepID=A0A4S4LQE9_9APHY|nr:hypothetical protein EUX98_g9597 [Antrodiella citrinella]